MLKVQGLARFRYAYPQRFTAAAGILVSREDPDRTCADFCPMKGLQVQLDLGTGGGSFGVGYASIVARRRPGWPIASAVFLGKSVRATVLRTWGQTPFDPPMRTFVGVESGFAIARVGFTFGIIRQVSSGPEHSEWRWTGGIGWGI